MINVAHSQVGAYPGIMKCLGFDLIAKPSGYQMVRPAKPILESLKVWTDIMTKSVLHLIINQQSFLRSKVVNL